MTVEVKVAHGTRGLAGGHWAPPFGMFAEAGQRALETWMKTNGTMVKDTFELAEEMLSVAQGWLEADVEAWRKLATCRNPADLFDWQQHVAQRATRQYLDAASKLAGLMTSYAGESMTFLKRDAEAPVRQKQQAAA